MTTNKMVTVLIVVLVAGLVALVSVSVVDERRANAAHDRCWADRVGTRSLKPGEAIVDDPCFGVTSRPTTPVRDA